MNLLSLPAWMDVLVNLIGYAGFIGIAIWHKSSDEITTGYPPVAPDSMADQLLEGGPVLQERIPSSFHESK